MSINEMCLRNLIREMVLAEAYSEKVFRALVLGSYPEMLGGVGGTNQNEIGQKMERVKKAIEADGALLGQLIAIINEFGEGHSNFRRINHEEYWGIKGLPTGESPSQESQETRGPRAGQESQGPRDQSTGQGNPISQFTIMNAVKRYLDLKRAAEAAIPVLMEDNSVLVPSPSGQIYFGKLKTYYPYTKDATFIFVNDKGITAKEFFTLKKDDKKAGWLMEKNIMYAKNPLYPYKNLLKYDDLVKIYDLPLITIPRTPMKVNGRAVARPSSSGFIRNAYMDEEGTFIIVTKFIDEATGSEGTKEIAFNQTVSSESPFIKENPGLFSLGS